MLATSIPTLHYLALRTETEPAGWKSPPDDPFASEYMWWRVVRSDDGPDTRLVSILPYEGELVRTRLMDMDRDALGKFDVDAFMA